MILGRMITTMRGERYSSIPTKWLTKVFVAGDIICFCIQGGGGGIMSQANDQAGVKLGEHIILGGLIFQIMVFAVFIAVAVVYHRRVRRAPEFSARNSDMLWERYLLMLYVVSVMIAGRNVFRVTEYGMGADGYLLMHEWTLYVFDGAQMALVLAVCIVWYKAKLVGKKGVTRDVEMSSGEMSSSEEVK